MLNPVKNKEDEAKMYAIAEMAAKFVSKYVNTMRLNGVPDTTLPNVITVLTQSIVGTLWIDPEAADIPTNPNPSLEEFDVSRLMPN